MSAANWLKKKRQQGIIWSSSYAAATIFGGLIFLGLMFWVVFMAAKLVLLSSFPTSWFVTPGSLLSALIVCGLIFVDSLYASRDDWSLLPSWLLREYLDIGPRLILEGYPHLSRVRTWQKLDVETCASVLMFLAGREVPTPRWELLRIFPGLDWDRLVKELRLLSGVIFFQRDPNRVTLTLPLRLELREFRKKARRVHIPTPEPEPAPVNEPHKLSAAEILGVASTATVSEIKTAYRIRIKECHPDRFANLDERSRELAEEWTKSLNVAYDTMLAEVRRN